MIVEKNQNLKIESSHDFQKKSFGINASAEAFSVLSSGLYQDKISAVIREISCNAIDAHKLAENGIKDDDGNWVFKPIPGQSKVPFTVNLPTVMNPVFKVRDFGPGLAEDQVFDLYTTYFMSTKQTSNDYTGALGLGSKSPFSLTSSFLVISFYNGTQTVYTAIIDEDGFPSIVKMSQTATDQPNGLEINVTVDHSNIQNFATRAANIFAFFETKPIITGNKINIPERKYSAQGTGWATREHSYGLPVGATQGNVNYNVDLASLNGKIPQDLYNFYNEVKSEFEFQFNIGDVENTASREALQYKPKTIAAIQRVLEAALKEMGEVVLQKFATAKTRYEFMCMIQKEFQYGRALGYAKQRLYKQGLIKFNGEVFSEDPRNVEFKTTHKLKVFYKDVPKGLPKNTTRIITGYEHVDAGYKYLHYGQLHKKHVHVTLAKQEENKRRPGELLSATYEHTHRFPVGLEYELYYNDNKSPLNKIKKWLTDNKNTYKHSIIIIDKDRKDVGDMFEKTFGYPVKKLSTLGTLGEVEKLVRTLRYYTPSVRDNYTFSNCTGTIETTAIGTRKDIKYYLISSGSAFTFVNPLDSTKNMLGGEEMHGFLRGLDRIGMKGASAILIIPQSYVERVLKEYPNLRPLEDIFKDNPYKSFSPEGQLDIQRVISYNTSIAASQSVNGEASKTYLKFLGSMHEAPVSPDFKTWAAKQFTTYKTAVDKLQSLTGLAKELKDDLFMKTIIERYPVQKADFQPDLATKVAIEKEINENFAILKLEFASFSPTYWSPGFDKVPLKDEKLKVFYDYLQQDWVKYSAKTKSLVKI